MQEKAKEPEIRFAGFTGAWEQRKFSKLYKRSSEKNDGSIGIERNITVATMQFKSDIRLSSDDYLKTYFTFKVGDIAFEGHQSKEFRYGRFVENDIGDGVVSHIFTVFRPIQRFDLHFWKYAINSENLMQKILSRSTKASTMMHDLVPEDFLNETFLVPSIDEQKAVGKFLHQIDNLLTLHQRKYEKLLNIKKSMLEKMFPKEGEVVPEIRFKGFTGAWEQREVSQLLLERNTQAPKSSEYPLMAFIANEGIAPKGERYDRSSLVTDEINKLYKRTERGDFIYSSNNLETGSIGLNNYGKASISPVYSIFSTTENADSDFIGHRLVRRDFIKAMVKWRQGVIYGQWRIHESDFLRISICASSVPEQQKIGRFLRQIDTLLTLHQRKLEMLKNVKQAFLEKMFV